MTLEHRLLALCASLALCAPAFAADDGSFSAGLGGIDGFALDDGRLGFLSSGSSPARGLPDAHAGAPACASGCDTAAPSAPLSAHPTHTLILAGLGAVGFVVRRRRVL